MTTVEKRRLDQTLRKRYFYRIIRSLVRIIDSSDKFARGHSEKVMRYCARMARGLRLDKKQATKIKIAALLHDIGKFTLDRTILNKSGELTEEEWRKIKKHPTIGAKIIMATGLLNEVANIVKYHHERYEGGGYPNPDKKGASIPLGSRLILVADAYDAMTSKRPYRKRPMSKNEAAIELMKNAGTQFDPQIVNLFIQIIK